MTTFPFLISVTTLAFAAATASAAPSPAAVYCNEAIALAGKIEAKMPVLIATADEIADHMIAGHHLWLGGSYEGFIIEGYYRAGGMMRAAWLHKPDELKPGDVLLLGTVDDANPADLELTKTAHDRGVLVVRIGPGTSASDLSVPCEDDAAAKRAAHLPLISAGDAMMLWTLTGELVGALTRRGKMTPMFESVLVPGGRERNVAPLKRTWEPTCPPAQPPGRLGGEYLFYITSYLRDLEASQLPKFDETGALVANAVAAGKKVYVIPFGHLPPYEVALGADPGVFSKLPANTNGESLAKIVHAGDVVLYIGYYDLPADIVAAAHKAGARLVSFVSGTPDKFPTQMGADINIAACWPFGDASVKLPGYDVRILPPSGVMTSVGYWMFVAEAQAHEAGR